MFCISQKYHTNLAEKEQETMNQLVPRISDETSCRKSIISDNYSIAGSYYAFLVRRYRVGGGPTDRIYSCETITTNKRADINHYRDNEEIRSRSVERCTPPPACVEQPGTGRQTPRRAAPLTPSPKGRHGDGRLISGLRQHE